MEAMARTQLGEKDKAIALLSRYYAKNPQRKAFISRDEAWYFKSWRTSRDTSRSSARVTIHLLHPADSRVSGRWCHVVPILSPSLAAGSTSQPSSAGHHGNGAST
jgi:hypothetical protein